MSTIPDTILYQYPIERNDYKWPTFSDAEFKRRHQIAQQFMDERGLDCLLVAGNNGIWERCWANIRWLSNYMGTMELDSFVVFPRQGEPTVLILGLNASNCSDFDFNDFTNDSRPWRKTSFQRSVNGL